MLTSAQNMEQNRDTFLKIRLHYPQQIEAFSSDEGVNKSYFSHKANAYRNYILLLIT